MGLMNVMRAAVSAARLVVVIPIVMTRWAGERFWTLFRPAAQRPAARATANGRAIARFCTMSGPTFAKLGQILSSRPDILSPQIIAQLEQLQDRMPAVPFRTIRATIEADLGRRISDVFGHFEERPLASASVAQVHRARLPDGTAVAVKVQRPRIARKFATDIALLRLLARMASLIPGAADLRPTELVDEFGQSLHSQLDFKAERDNNRLFADTFKDIRWVRLPWVREDLSGARTITMEFTEGRKIPDYMRERKQPDNELATRLYTLYLLMSIERNVLHADMHPGNLLIDSERRIIVLDTGLVYKIPRVYTQKYLQLLLAFGTYDGHLLSQAYLQGRDDLSPEHHQFIGDKTHELTQSMLNMDVSKIDMADVWKDLMGVLRKHHVTFDRQLTMIAVTDSTFSGMARQLDPDFDFFAFMVKGITRLVFDKKALPATDPFLQAALRIEMTGGAKKYWAQKNKTAA